MENHNRLLDRLEKTVSLPVLPSAELPAKQQKPNSSTDRRRLSLKKFECQRNTHKKKSPKHNLRRSENKMK